VPPADPFTFIPPLFALTGNVDQMLASVAASDATYTESAQSFMVPPDLSLQGLGHKGRMIVYHGVSDPIFSADDTRGWYESLSRHRAKRSARLYLVPGMSHCSNGPATDQFDLLTPLMRWVEKGVAPKEIVASVRGPANPGGPNFELPAAWSPERTRPLCPFPRTATYHSGDIESADSFKCK
jgi:feruloyl esterase